MKILSLSNSDIWPWGQNKGIPSVFYPQKGLADKGHEVFFLCPKNDKEQKTEEDCQGINIVRFSMPFGLNFNYANSFAIKPFWNHLRAIFISNLNWYLYQPYCLFAGIRLAKKIRPDIIYVHFLTPAFCGFLISRMFKAKLIIRVYGVKDLYHRWDDLLYRIKEFRGLLALKMPADYFIITNDGTKGDALAKKMGVQQERIRCWRNGIDFKKATLSEQERSDIYRNLGIPENSKVIISTCRLAPIYRTDKTLEIILKVLEKRQDVFFIIAGDGPQRNELEAMSRQSRAGGQVKFLGVIERQRINKLLHIADLFVFLPQNHNCTNTMWEAMMSGCCIVTTENDAIKEVLQDEAVLIPESKINSASEIILELLDNDALRKEYAQKIIKKADSVLETWDKRIDKEVELIEELKRR
ncbi:MAG: glycosyltransferase family 4 protein [Candidatus Omnitrophota bacterium]